MDLSYIVKQLRAAGVDVRIPGDEDLRHDLIVDGMPVEVKRFHRDPTPSDLKRVRDRAERDNTAAVLLFTSRMTPALADLASTDPSLVLISDHEVFVRGHRTHLDAKRDVIPMTPKSGPAPHARFAIGRALLALGSGASQRVLATAAGVSQGSVSQSVANWAGLSRKALFDRLVTEYPGPGGLETFWWADTPVRDQGADLHAAGALVSGDLAASAISGWRQPERAIGYTKYHIDLTLRGYVLASADDYSLRVVVPKDGTLWATAETFGSRDHVDPVIAAYDVLRTATTGDEGQAVDRLRETVTGA